MVDLSSSLWSSLPEGTLETSLVWRSTFDFCMSDKGKLSTRLRDETAQTPQSTNHPEQKKMVSLSIYYNISEQNKYIII